MWVTETAWPPIVLLLGAALLAGLLWWSSRRALFAALAIVCLLLVPTIYVVERSIVTPAEEVEQLVLDLRNEVVAGDLEKTLSFISASSAAERAVVTSAMALADVHDDLRITDLSVVTVAGDSQALSRFRANGTVSSQAFGEHRAATRWEVSWRREEGAWRIYKIVRLNPLNGDEIGLLSGD